jgi:hypothetical protein
MKFKLADNQVHIRSSMISNVMICNPLLTIVIQHVPYSTSAEPENLWRGQCYLSRSDIHNASLP